MAGMLRVGNEGVDEEMSTGRATCDVKSGRACLRDDATCDVRRGGHGARSER